MKIKRVYKILIFTMLVLIPALSEAQVPNEIILSLKAGNAAKLSDHFSQNVELVILDSENVYSKAHARQVIGDFFKNYPPNDFSVIHQGGKGDSRYVIGNLQVPNNRFRVYFLIKTTNGASQIHQLRIEQQSN